MIKKEQTIKKNYLLNHKGNKYKSNTLIGLIWNFLLKK